MPDHPSQCPPIPADYPSRALTLAQPDAANLPHIGLVGDTYTITASGADTGGRFCVIDMLVSPGGGPGPHRHDFEETFLLLEGEIDFTFRRQKYPGRAGATVNVPSNAPHQFCNAGSQPARTICICAPAGNDQFFLKVGTPVPTRATAPPKLNQSEMAEFLPKAKGLAREYRTGLQDPS